MSSFVFLIIGYLLIFVSLILSYFRLKNIEVSKDDYLELKKVDKIIALIQHKFLEFLKIVKSEFVFILFNLSEKILRRIKIEALKIESWANKKLENLKERRNNKEKF